MGTPGLFIATLQLSSVTGKPGSCSHWLSLGKEFSPGIDSLTPWSTWSLAVDFVCVEQIAVCCRPLPRRPDRIRWGVCAITVLKSRKTEAQLFSELALSPVIIGYNILETLPGGSNRRVQLLIYVLLTIERCSCGELRDACEAVRKGGHTHEVSQVS